MGTGDEQRLKVLRQRVRTQPSTSAWEELALQLIALKRDEGGEAGELAGLARSP